LEAINKLPKLEGMKEVFTEGDIFE